MVRNTRHGDHPTNKCAQRAGLSALEAIGCVIAVVGGVWLGAIYLGIDVRHVAHTALAEADLLDKVPEDWRPVGPDDKRMTREQLVATLREELGVLRSEISALRNEPNNSESAKPSAKDTASAAGDESNANAPTYEATLAYWTRLNEIALGEIALQRDAESAFDNQNAAKVFAIKGRINRFAARAVEAIPDEGADASVVQFGRQLSGWYVRSAELNEKAVQIWETPAGSQGRAQLNEEWNRAELQHRNEARLLAEKGGVVRGAISRRFGQEFPEFVRPKAPPAANERSAG